MGILHRAEIVEVFDKNMNSLKKGRSEEVVEWIIMNPLGCESVTIQGLLDILSIDQYMDRYDALETPNTFF